MIDQKKFCSKLSDVESESLHPEDVPGIMSAFIYSRVYRKMITDNDIIILRHRMEDGLFDLIFSKDENRNIVP